MRTIKQNLFWAFAYNVALIPIAAGVLYPPFGILLNPIFAAAAMGLSQRHGGQQQPAAAALSRRRLTATRPAARDGRLRDAAACARRVRLRAARLADRRTAARRQRRGPAPLCPGNADGGGSAAHASKRFRPRLTPGHPARWSVNV